MNLLIIILISFLFISILGTLLHFTHNWFKDGFLLHIFSALNESTWEHMKMLVLPTTLVCIFQYIYIRNTYENILNSLFFLFITELISIPILFEISKLFFKKVPIWISISIFYISIILGLIVEYIFLTSNISILGETVSLILICLIVFLFSLFTFYPPKHILFKDPVSKRYGHVK